MSALHPNLRRQLENTVKQGREIAEAGARAALEGLAAGNKDAFPHLKPAQKELRLKLRARGRQLGDQRDKNGSQSGVHLAEACAYEYWHRMLFARFLAENSLLIHATENVAVTLDEVDELAKAEGTDCWTLAGRYAATMLPQIFRPDDPLLQVAFAPEHKKALEQLLTALPVEIFTAGDALGWCYQFWQAERKDQVNASGNKIGADELPAVTQLFTEDYMVDFLLDNTLGAWHAGKMLAAKPGLAERAESEEDLRQAVALPGCSWKYLRFIKGKDGQWTPAAGTFDGWPKTAKELTCLDPCMGSGHFVVAMFERLVALRMAEEKLDEAAAVAAVIRDNLFGLEIDPRCTQIAAFNLALAAWRHVGYCELSALNLACSGLAPNATEEEWLSLAKRANAKQARRVPADLIHNGLVNLYDLFSDAPTLGSLINPKALGSVVAADYETLLPYLTEAFALESADDEIHERAVAAQGIVKAAEILAGKFTLVVTNVPYLGFKKMSPILHNHCESNYQVSKADLAAVFSERCLQLCSTHGAIGVVIPQTITFLGTFTALREKLLKNYTLSVLAKLGTKAFQAPMYDFTVALFIAIRSDPITGANFAAMDASAFMLAEEKAKNIPTIACSHLIQENQLKNPDSRFTIEEIGTTSLLGQIAISTRGVVNGDIDKWIREFWEIISLDSNWRFLQSAVTKTDFYGGSHNVIDWSTGGDGMLRPGLGNKAYGRLGVAVSRMAALPSCLYLGELYDQNTSVLIPEDVNLIPALWAYCSSPLFNVAVRKLDQKVGVTPATLLKIPFDLAHWKKVAAEKYPHGMPKPRSDDPTQWLFNGHPKDADQPLHVAVARLLGYQWPRQTGSSFPDCPALGPDGLEKCADDGGIACIPSVRGEAPAAEGLREMLARAYGKDWKPAKMDELLGVVNYAGSSLEDWLRNGFFDQHCKLFHQRPFIWHLWDGRKDGFSALVNYHKLDHKLLEKLTYTYLGDWIKHQHDAVKKGAGGADDRLLKAQQLQDKLKLILEGDAPYDIFVRWKPLDEQPLGWHPDLNDGVRLNIRPFVEAGVLRKTPNIKWGIDRGKNPKGAPWGEERDNDRHLSLKEKLAAGKKR